ncbi:hypothetical protein HNQ92_000987 [Rhabdobacter roseus]|uniref:Prolin-rich transmembrane protein n=1 Tax=Rhabdobacter roseus TaxID=1655419 RepID=A0A840TFG7_9BACT|nr:DUF6600 domain-containing protein [Rhabdobacter roseus]MBB5282866.1 hypothetical protein [Rhabdobacter roseus]
MKTTRRLRIFSLLAFLVVAGGLSPNASAQPGLSVSFQTFYNDLAPYGRWSSHPQYGSVWSPYVEEDFQPYATNGRWIATEYGNTWESYYPWGWAPFHYGRWFFDDYNGWTWVPDYEWGPAWVNWRSGGDYYGWAPLLPGFHVNIAVNIPYNYWVFVPRNYIYRPRIFSYCVPRARVVNIYNRTTIINNYYRNDNRVYASGPSRYEVERHTRSKVPVYQASEVTSRSNRTYAAEQNNSRVYRADDSGRDRALSRQDRTPATSGRSSNSNQGRYSTEADRGTYQEPARGRETYNEPGRSRSNSSVGTPAPERVYSTPDRSTRPQPAYEAPARSSSPSRTERSPAERSPAERSPRSAPQPSRSMEQPSSRQTAPRQSSMPQSSPRENSSRSRVESTAPSSRSNSQAAPASRSTRQAPAERSSSSSESSRSSRGPR